MLKARAQSARRRQALEAIAEELSRLEREMNKEGDERSPTGDDYNELASAVAHELRKLGIAFEDWQT